VEPTFTSSEPGRHGWAELLTLVDGIRRIAHDRTLLPAEALGRIRDLFRNYDDDERGETSPFA
jgi:hypothetical protein